MTMKELGLPDGLCVDRALRFVWQAAPRWTIISAVLLMIQGVVPLISLYVLKLVVDRLTGMTAGSGGAFEGLVLLIGVALGVAVIGTLCSAMLGHANIIQSHLVADHMQRLVQRKSIEMDLEYYENPQYYDKLHRAQREAPSRPIRIVQGLTQLVQHGLTLLGTFALLLTFHWGIVATVLVAAFPVIFYRLKYAQAMYTWHREKTTNERLSGYFNQVLTTAENAKEVRVFGFGPFILSRFGELRARIGAGTHRISAQRYRTQFITESTAALAGYGSLVFIAYAAFDGSITLGALVMYFGAFQVALGSLRATLGGVAELYENNLFLSTLDEFLEVPKRVLEPLRPRRMPRPWRVGLQVENLNFCYPGTERLVLEGIEMTIRPGETVALVGRNGSGKTTLAKLICRLYDPSSGRITVEGVDIREFKIEDLRREISVIYQDFGRYHMTARENIWLGRPELSLDDISIVAAAKQVGIHEELRRLPQGYDTVMSRTLAEGEELSLGQWQKLALARAFVRDAQLIVLDEPTSSLDAAAEFEFFEQFRALTKNRSALVISHRFSTVRLADHIYVLDSGRLIEQGTHEELLARGGLYASLYRKQASYYYELPNPGVTRSSVGRRTHRGCRPEDEQEIEMTSLPRS